MKKMTALFMLSLSAMIFAKPFFPDEPRSTAIESIRPVDVRRHVDFLASDSLMGRNTPSPYLDKAADYIANEFKSYRLQPINGSYFQPFAVNKIRLGTPNRFTLKNKNGEHNFRLKKDFMPFEFTANKAIKAELVFVGYGITAPEYHYDDYAKVDVKGKIVLVLRHEPGEKDENSVFDGRKKTVYSNLRNKLENAVAHGAVGLILVNDPLNHRSLRPRGFPWPSLYEGIPDDAVPYTLSLTENEKILVVHAGKKLIQEVFSSVDSLKKIQRVIDSSLKPHSFALSGVSVSMQTSTKTESEMTKNVVAMLPGSDSKLKDQAVIIGAHYDHVGFIPEKRYSGEDYIYNGADDNASGTSALLEIAQAFSKGQAPKRTVIFIAFAGEEKGLFGSKVYTEKPLWPLAETKAMLNMDMVGRNAGNKVTIIGFSKSPDLNAINTHENQFIGMTLEYNGEKFYKRRDHYNFARKGVPILFYSTMTHEDYHKVSDNPDKINEGKIAMIARLAYRTTWEAANTSRTFKLLDK